VYRKSDDDDDDDDDDDGDGGNDGDGHRHADSTYDGIDVLNSGGGDAAGGGGGASWVRDLVGAITFALVCQSLLIFVIKCSLSVFITVITNAHCVLCIPFFFLFS
jgi:hypothetical protein